MKHSSVNESVVIQNVCKQFPKTKDPALSSINANLPKGTIIGIVGPDGAGKTTLIRLMAGLLMPTSGSITIDGYDTLKQAEQIHSFSGYMPQKFGLYEDLTVIQNLNLYADLRGLETEERAASFTELLHFTNLAPFTERLAQNLSGGMKQKLGLACALIKKPKILFLDEPSVGVDPISRRELWRMIQDLLNEGITVIWSTVYLDEAQRCPTILLLNHGTILYQGDPQVLTQNMDGRVYKIKAPSDNRRVHLAHILKEPNVVDAVIQGQDIRIVFKENHKATIDHETLEPTPPRFEDAFIDMLGGSKMRESSLAKRTPVITASSETPVKAEKLTKRFGSFIAANEISFSVKKGEIFGLLGPNGAGKSTTFKMLCGLLAPSSGTAEVSSINVQSAPATARSLIGYMAQKFSLYGNLSVQQNLDFFAGIYNLLGEQKQTAIREMVDIFDLKPFLNTSADILPLGFKQRLSLACATMHHPHILFLDEPTSGVDPAMRREFWTHINGLVQKNVTVLVSTHFMDEAEYCDTIALIYRGRVIKLDTPDALKQCAKTDEHPNPTLEDAFIQLIEQYDHEHPM